MGDGNQCACPLVHPADDACIVDRRGYRVALSKLLMILFKRRIAD
jgi:hypothetical protein